MIFDDATWLNALLAFSNALLIAAVTVVLLRFRGLQRPPPPPESALRQDGEIERRMRRLERLASELSLDESGARPATQPAPSYETALRLVRLGAGADDVAGPCGLSRGEAELLARLHGPEAERTGDGCRPQ